MPNVHHYLTVSNRVSLIQASHLLIWSNVVAKSILRCTLAISRLGARLAGLKDSAESTLDGVQPSLDTVPRGPSNTGVMKSSRNIIVILSDPRLHTNTGPLSTWQPVPPQNSLLILPSVHSKPSRFACKLPYLHSQKAPTMASARLSQRKVLADSTKACTLYGDVKSHIP